MTLERTSASDLLSIDVVAELRKVSGLAIEGPWQVPSTLVRWAMSRGAQRADVRLGRRSWRVSTDVALAGDQLQLIGAILDARRADAERHRAFVALEGSEARELASLASCARGSLSVSLAGSAATRTVRWQPGSQVAARDSSPGPVGTTFELRGALPNRGRAADWVRDVARFADLEVTIDGAPIPRGFSDSLGTRTLVAPLEGRASLSPIEGGACVWLLHRGAAMSRLTLAEAPAAEVALELGGTGCEPTPAACREAAAKYADELIDQLVELLIARGRRLGCLPPAEQIALRRQLLRAAVFRRARPEISALPMIPALVGTARQPRLFSLSELEKAATLSGSLGFISPSDKTADLVAGGAPLVVLDTVERARLARRTGLRLVPPPRQARLPLAERAKRQLLRVSRQVRALLRRERSSPPGSLAPLAVRRLEDAFRHALPSHGGPRVRSVRFVGGSGAPTVFRGHVTLPIDDPLVAKSLALVERDERHAAAAVIALGQGELFAEGGGKTPSESA